MKRILLVLIVLVLSVLPARACPVAFASVGCVHSFAFAPTFAVATPFVQTVTVAAPVQFAVAAPVCQTVAVQQVVAAPVCVSSFAVASPVAVVASPVVVRQRVFAVSAFASVVHIPVARVAVARAFVPHVAVSASVVRTRSVAVSRSVGYGVGVHAGVGVRVR